MQPSQVSASLQRCFLQIGLELSNSGCIMCKAGLALFDIHLRIGISADTSHYAYAFTAVIITLIRNYRCAEVRCN
jgi:hypothetical protein